LSIEEAADGGVSVGEWVYVWTKMRVRVVYPQEGRSQAYVMVETSSQSHGLTLREGSRIVRITEVEADG
jgi:hypothetical protein